MQSNSAVSAGTNPCPALTLWSHVLGELEGYLFTFTGKQSGIKDNDLIETEQVPWAWPTKAPDAYEYLLSQSSKGRDCYFGTHLFATPFNRKGENSAEHIQALWVDGDGAQVPESWPQPTASVISSPGREHFYWRLSRPVGPDQAKLLNKRLCYGMGGDKGKWGLGTVLRVPGTYNYKRETPTLVEGVIHA